ncbi:MAG: hypothetical protein ACREHC_00095 [Candidatus Levyibacteriota bacterium]
MNKEVNKTVIAKYYLSIELGKPLKNDESKVKLIDFINSLNEDDIWNLLRVVSEEYRKNNVYQILHDSMHIWNLETINITDIKLSDVNERVKPYLENTSYDPLKFKALLEKNGNIEALKEFQPRKVSDREAILLFICNEGIYKIVDGIHRLVSLVLQGHTKINGYIGYQLKS